MKVLVNGAEPDEATFIVILLHGRGAGGEDILGLSSEFEDEDICWLAPTAVNRTWYPDRFLVRRSQNEPFLTLSTEQVKGLMDEFPAEKIILAGFSQGACLTSDILARFPRKIAGAWMFSGGLIGDEDEMPKVEGDLAGLPVTISGSSQDPHIPMERMKLTADHLKKMGAEVDTLHYDVPSHEIAAEEIELAKKSLLKMRKRAS
jgi:predicted esterase